MSDQDFSSKEDVLRVFEEMVTTMRTKLENHTKGLIEFGHVGENEEAATCKVWPLTYDGTLSEDCWFFGRIPANKVDRLED